MFENDYNIVGIHATHLKYLVNEAKVFPRYIDVYLLAAIFGFLHGRKEEKDNSSQDRARIYADAFSNERLNCDFVFRLVMLLDGEKDLSSLARIDRAFRDDAMKESDESITKKNSNMAIFNSYVLGGIEELFEKLTSTSTSREDYIDSIFDLSTKFKEEMEGINYENKLRELVHNN